MLNHQLHPPPPNSVPVAFYHTHAPLTHVPNTFFRDTGFSDADIKFSNFTKFDIIITDYVGTLGDDGKFTVRGGHGIDAPAKVYIYSPK